MIDPFRFNNYTVRKKLFTFMGDAFHIFDPDGNVVFYSKLKPFKLKEDIRIYAGEDFKTEILSIKARRIIDFASAYDVIDSETGGKIAVLKRKGIKSMLRDEWIIMDSADKEIGIIKEDSMMLAMIRRFLLNLIPQGFTAQLYGKPVCRFRQNFNPFILKINVDFSEDMANIFDKRIGLAAALLLGAIEGRQD